MTAEELRTILTSDEYKHELESMSSYLASIKQERPIVYALAKLLWNRKLVFQVEAKRRDLMIGDTHVEFKYSFDCGMDGLKDELKKYADKPLDVMWADVCAKKLSKTWAKMPQVYEDICIKKPDIFVWFVCARDLSAVSSEAVKRICWSAEQCKWSSRNPYSDRSYLTVVDSFLERLQAVRAFSVIREEIATSGDFPSVYHLRICEFPPRASSGD
jgi:hypothetical protein